tara:strand:+ start:611 stop:901 length:291 start_codon:yes stop_codon:yes gene_type:complete
MKSKELINSLSFSDLSRISIFSSLGFCILFFVIGSLLILTGATAPITFNGSEVGGLKGFLVLLGSLPLYLLMLFVMQTVILGLGLWISKKLFFFKK